MDTKQHRQRSSAMDGVVEAMSKIGAAPVVLEAASLLKSAAEDLIRALIAKAAGLSFRPSTTYQTRALNLKPYSTQRLYPGEQPSWPSSYIFFVFFFLL